MKKSILTLAILGLTAAGSFAQGYFLFAGAKSTVFDNFTSPGTSSPSSGTAYVGFLIGSSSASFGAASVATNATVASPAPITTALANGFSWATDVNGGGIVSVLTGTTTLGKGGWNYNASTAFQVGNTATTGTYTVVPVAWNAAAGANPVTGFGSFLDIGWGNAIQYSAGTQLSTLPTFSGAGVLPFGVAPIPEPTSFALAGIGAAAMMIFRRKK